MTNITKNPLLAMDYYKGCHDLMLPKGITKSVSYYIPRSSRIPGVDKAVFFGLQGFLRRMNEMFEKAFDDPDRVIGQYRSVMDATFGKGNYNADKWVDLLNLGYLPIEVRTLPEGTRVPMGCPMFCITNTKSRFAWLPQFLESWLSAELWHPIVVATVADLYKHVVKLYYSMTCPDKDPSMALGLFSFRGEESYESAMKSGAAWATAFRPCATVPTAGYLHDYYYADDYGIVGSPSTEHAVMCSNTAVDGNEVDLLRRLLTEIYPNTSFSAVLDSYDYWHMVKDVLPTLKKEIIEHNGCFLVRGDSGDPVDVTVNTVKALWDIFGGTVNEQGCKVLDPHVKAIYGDGITYDRCLEIYRRLVKDNFAACNISLGVGSFSTQALQLGGEMYPFTRDTFNIAIKATYIECDGKEYLIQKSPKVNGAHGETTEYFKKSPKGCLSVDKNLKVTGGLTWAEQDTDKNMLKRIYYNGYMMSDTLDDIRRRLE